MDQDFEFEEIPQLSLKKSVSVPAPPINEISVLGEIFGEQPTEEITQIIKKLKKFNPRFVEKHAKTHLDKKNFKEKNGNQIVQSLKNITLEEKNSNKHQKSKKMNPHSQKYIRDENISDNSEENNIVEKKNSLPVNRSINYHTYGEEKNEKFLKSKIIQNDYEKGDLIKKEEIFENAINNLKEMISDTYDNYILQKILERGLWIHKKRLFDEIKISFLDFSLQKYGCRVIQKTIEAFQEPNTEEFDFIFNKIKDNISTLILHENGNFIIQKCLEVYQKDYFRFVLDCINEKLPILSSHKYGCLIIQKLSEIYKDKDEHIKNEIDYVIMKILAVSHELSKKEYSNYIIQHLLEAGHCSHKDKLLNNYILPNFIALSCDQFASNVAEKAIIFSDRQFRCNLWNTLSISKENVLKLVNDRYGNYVMQRVYEYSDNDIRMEFAKFLDLNYNYLSSQAQYVLKFIQKFK